MEWLDRSPIGGEDYSIWKNVKKDHKAKKLPDDAFNVLRGVHLRGGLSLAIKPSAEDLAFLKRCYGM